MLERSRIATAVAALAVCVSIALGVSAWQSALSRDEALDMEARARSARRAATLRPWDPDAHTAAALLTGRVLASRGELERARRLLADTWLDNRDADDLRSELGSVSKAIERRDSRKAHVQHGREGPQGELDPEDVIR